MNNCKNCNEPINGNYCSHCGQPAQLKRINHHYIIQEIGDFFLANKGMIYTVKRIALSPGKSVRQFIAEDRYRFVKPITFLFVTSIIYTLACYLFHIKIEDYYFIQPSPDENEFPTLNLFLTWMTNYHGYTSIISGLFVAFWIKLFFRKSGYNIFEIFILLCFVSGIAALFSSIIVMLQGVAHLNLIHIASLISITYYAWAIGQFFDRKRTLSYIKAFISCLLGYFIFGLLVAIVAMSIDLILKH
jgi:hypothetical protein